MYIEHERKEMKDEKRKVLHCTIRSFSTSARQLFCFFFVIFFLFPTIFFLFSPLHYPTNFTTASITCCRWASVFFFPTDYHFFTTFALWDWAKFVGDPILLYKIHHFYLYINFCDFPWLSRSVISSCKSVFIFPYHSEWERKKKMNK